MANDSTSSTNTASVAEEPHDVALQRRIYAEFSEMPGLKLTLPQASRLFGVDRPRCEDVLGSLVEVGALVVVRGTFVRRDGGRWHS